MFVQKNPLVILLAFVRRQVGKLTKVRRANENAYLSGFGAGLAYYLECPLWMARMALLFMLLLLGRYVLPVYFLLWILLPQWEHDPEDYDKKTD